MARTLIYRDFDAGSIVELTEAEMLEIGLPVPPTDVQTTDATVTTLVSITPTNNSRGFLKVALVANKKDGSGGLAGSKFIHWKKQAGTLTMLNSATDVADNLETLTTATWAVDATGGDLRIRVTGEAATVIDWSCFYELKTLLNTYAP